MTLLIQWALRHNIPHAALQDLRQRLGMLDHAPVPDTPGTSEAAVSNRLRLAAAAGGACLWRNNVGVLNDKRGVPVRFGLCNDSKELNKKCKSADLIGIFPLLITPAHVGTVVGQFWSVEAKEVGWVYTGQDREPAQATWAQAVVARGGRACFATDAGDLT